MYLKRCTADLQEITFHRKPKAVNTTLRWCSIKPQIFTHPITHRPAGSHQRSPSTSMLHALMLCFQVPPSSRRTLDLPDILAVKTYNHFLCATLPCTLQIQRARLTVSQWAFLQMHNVIIYLAGSFSFINLASRDVKTYSWNTECTLSLDTRDAANDPDIKSECWKYIYGSSQTELTQQRRC